MSKTIYTGLEGSGKSLRLARQATELVYRNAKWLKKSGIKRDIVSNEKFTKEFEDWSSSMGITIRYWTHLGELIKERDVDVIIDEVGNYFDSRSWEDLSLDVRRWLNQGSKCGIELYGAAQDFAQIDISFRRLVSELWVIKKGIGSHRPSATKPPVKRIWGICFLFALDPTAYEEKTKKFAYSSMIPQFFTIKRRDCEAFDTGQMIGRSDLVPLRHQKRFCERHEKAGGDGSCDFCLTKHK